MEITEFVRTRIAEDEAAVRERASGAPIHRVGCYYYNSSISPLQWTAECCDCDEDGSAARRQLAECEAKRKIVERYAYLLRHGDSGDARWVLPILALPYADHPDYDPDWTLEPRGTW